MHFILKRLTGNVGTSTSLETSTETLAATLDKLESISSEWLLILDSADNQEPCREESEDGINPRNFLPSCGRVLITTRDRRFRGELADVEKAVQVKPMADREAYQLLVKSVPQDLRGEISYEPVSRLLEGLGNLPLAIAQAAANMREFEHSLESYSRFYQDKKCRIDLLKAPVQVPKWTAQSVLITWEISVEHIGVSSPPSVSLLCYMGFLHWSAVPKSLLKCFPLMTDLNEADPANVLKKLLDLSPIETKEANGTERLFPIHLMVHQWISNRLSVNERKFYIESVVDCLAIAFPVVEDGESRLIADVLRPHALEVIERAMPTDIRTKPVARLLQLAGASFSQNRFFSKAKYILDKTVELAEQLWEKQDSSIVWIRVFRADHLVNVGNCEALEEECNYILESLPSMDLIEALRLRIAQKIFYHFTYVDRRFEHPAAELEKWKWICQLEQTPRDLVRSLFQICRTLTENGASEETLPYKGQLLEKAKSEEKPGLYARFASWTFSGVEDPTSKSSKAGNFPFDIPSTCISIMKIHIDENGIQDDPDLECRGGYVSDPGGRTKV